MTCELICEWFQNADEFWEYNEVLTRVWHHILYDDCLVCRVAKKEARDRLHRKFDGTPA